MVSILTSPEDCPRRLLLVSSGCFRLLRKHFHTVSWSINLILIVWSINMVSISQNKDKFACEV